MNEYTHQFRAMGTEVAAWLWADQALVAQQALAETERFFNETEAQLSRFRPESELSRLNQSAGQPFEVSPLLFNLVEQALTWRKRSGGIFDPTVLPTLIAHGYDRSFEALADRPNEEADLIVKFSPGQVKLNRGRQTITLPTGAGLDLGGIAKGWAVQQALERLARLGPALVDAGGDIACAGHPPDGPTWLVGVADPQHADTDLAVLTLKDEAIATSSLTRRRWQHHGAPAHHLIDPRTGAPAEADLLSVTVIGPRLPTAEIHAKVALIMGTKQGLAYLAAQPNLAALLVTAAGNQRTCGSFKDKAYVNSAPIFLPLV